MNLEQVRAGFVGFGEVNTPRALIEHAPLPVVGRVETGGEKSSHGVREGLGQMPT